MEQKKEPELNVIKRLEPKKQEAIAAFIKNYGNITVTMQELDMNRGTFYNWLKDPDFVQAIAIAKERRLDYAEEKLLQRIDKESDACLIFFLKTQGKHRGYIERYEHSGVADQPIVIQVANQITKELIERT